MLMPTSVFTGRSRDSGSRRNSIEGALRASGSLPSGTSQGAAGRRGSSDVEGLGDAEHEIRDSSYDPERPGRGDAREHGEEGGLKGGRGEALGGDILGVTSWYAGMRLVAVGRSPSGPAEDPRRAWIRLARSNILGWGRGL